MVVFTLNPSFFLPLAETLFSLFILHRCKTVCLNVAHAQARSVHKSYSELLIRMSSFHVWSLNTAVCVISRRDCSSWQAVTVLMCLICRYASKADERDAAAAADTTSRIKDFPLQNSLSCEMFHAVKSVAALVARWALAPPPHQHLRHPAPPPPRPLLYWMPKDLLYSLEIANVSASSRSQLCNV